jgi:elongation factor P--beta-lysine ligase
MFHPLLQVIIISKFDLFTSIFNTKFRYFGQKTNILSFVRKYFAQKKWLEAQQNSPALSAALMPDDFICQDLKGKVLGANGL